MKILAEQEAERKRKAEEDSKQAAEVVRQDTPVIDKQGPRETNNESNDAVNAPAAQSAVNGFTVETDRTEKPGQGQETI